MAKHIEDYIIGTYIDCCQMHPHTLPCCFVDNDTSVIVRQHHLGTGGVNCYPAEHVRGHVNNTRGLSGSLTTFLCGQGPKKLRSLPAAALERLHVHTQQSDVFLSRTSFQECILVEAAKRRRGQASVRDSFSALGEQNDQERFSEGAVDTQPPLAWQVIESGRMTCNRRPL